MENERLHHPRRYLSGVDCDTAFQPNVEKNSLRPGPEQIIQSLSALVPAKLILLFLIFKDLIHTIWFFTILHFYKENVISNRVLYTPEVITYIGNSYFHLRKGMMFSMYQRCDEGRIMMKCLNQSTIIFNKFSINLFFSL